jgi:mRNA-degrading endonuclease RelE of RelBE toxin-antitoxin system
LTLQVHWTDRALKDAARLDRRTRERIVTAVERLAESGRGDIRRLQGVREEIFRLRIGDWRLLFSEDREAGTLVVRRVLPRGSAYQP